MDLNGQTNKFPVANISPWQQCGDKVAAAANCMWQPLCLAVVVRAATASVTQKVAYFP